MSLMKSHFFEVTRNWINFRLRSFLYQGTLWQKIQAAFSFIRVVTVNHQKGRSSFNELHTLQFDFSVLVQLIENLDVSSILNPQRSIPYSSDMGLPIQNY